MEEDRVVDERVVEVDVGVVDVRVVELVRDVVDVVLERVVRPGINPPVLV